MDFAARVRTLRVACLSSEIAVPGKPFGIGHMYIYNFMLRMTDTMTSQNIELSSWDTLYSAITHIIYDDARVIVRSFNAQAIASPLLCSEILHRLSNFPRISILQEYKVHIYEFL
jgi:hypothetical protein